MTRLRVRARALGGILGLLLAAALAPVTAAEARSGPDEPRLHLVTLDGPGTAGYRGALPPAAAGVAMKLQQNRLLDLVGAPEPMYRWTSALNGFAVELTAEQVLELEADPSVTLVEPNEVRHLAGRPSTAGLGVNAPRRGGAGTVIGVIDTGLAPESTLFAAAVRLGKEPRRFSGGCLPGEQWQADDCDDKVVGARWFVDGFGADNLRSTAYLSARDTDGHGTQVASIAAGNARVPVRVGGQRLGRFGGMAPQARIAVYKACWGAPDPADDGCATADLVTAIDHATSDRVDVISLAVGGPAEIDTVERALLGAAEADILVAAAAGNSGTAEYAAHPSPWVSTVGGAIGQRRLGRVVLAGGGPRLEGAMVSTRTVRPTRLVIGQQVPAAGVDRADARVCAPGSLDAGRVEGAIVLCERGGVGRVDKSQEVRLADGVGMVLVNVGPGDVAADFHSVPTVHLADAAGRELRRWVARHRGAQVTLRPMGVSREPRAVARWSSSGSPIGGALKPDLVAPASGVLGAVPGAQRWDFVTGTSAAAAYTAGVAATLLGRTGWSAATVRSALATTAAPLPGPVLRTGAGRLRPDAAARPGLVYEIDRFDYRAWLTGDRPSLNTPSILFADGQRRARRTITNVADRPLYFSSSTLGFRRNVLVRPAAVELGPGESATFTVVARGSSSRADQGHVVWRGATGTTTSIPVQISR